MKRAGPSPTRHISALPTPLRTPTIISGAPVRGPISISGSITPLICGRNRTESYDANGNMTRESTLPGGQSSASGLPNLTSIGDVRRADQAFGFINEVEDDDQNEYIRTFSWDAENRLKTVLTSNGRSVRYLYDADGTRTTKYAGDGAYTEGLSGETLYYNQWWTETEDSGSFRRAKHIYVGQERIVTRLSNPAIGGSPYEDVNTYYYHPDHLGSAHSITDSEGNPYERIEYTPYGEMWIEIQEDDATESYNYIPFRFTGKEYDQETGLYYYGARYLDPKTSRWVSGDPAGFGLMNPMDTEGKPRQGYSIVEATNWYSYVSNNPVKYVDPDGSQQIPGQSRALYKVPDNIVSGWISDWVSTENSIADLNQKVIGLRVEQGLLANRRTGILDEATLMLSPFVVAGVLEAVQTGSVQTLAETSVEAKYYAEELIAIKQRERTIPGEIDVIESEIEVKQELSDMLMSLIEGQAKLDLWLRKEGEE